MTERSEVTVAVVGAGAIGLACAWRLSQRGCDVTVLDPQPGTGASHVAAGMLCPVTEVHYGEEPLLALNLEAAHRWPAFAEELTDASGRPTGFRAEGTLVVAFDDDDVRVLDELLRFQQSLGLDVERLRSSECRDLEPGLSPRVRGGLRVSGDHQVDNRRMVAALLLACQYAGVRFVRRAVQELETDDVINNASRVVLACGCWTSALVPHVPVRPVKGQILRLRFPAAEPVLTRNVRGIAEGRSVYLVPRVDGELVIGATVEERGYDMTVTAGAVQDLLRAAADLVPGVGELRLVETLAGLRPGTPDNAPIIGVDTDDERIVHATGHYRNGILLTPLTADAVAGLIVDGEVPPVVAPFGLERFGG